ncbi:MAG: tetratricopeptide repeat protein [Kiritimatiellia bacterium]
MVCNSFKNNSVERKRTDLFVSLGLGAVAFLVYLLTMSRYIFPGLSAKYMAAFSGIDPLTQPVYPLWGTLVSAVSSIPVFSLTVRLNLISVVCSTISVVLIYRIMSFLLYETIREEYSVEHADKVSVWGGVFSSVALMFSVPLWQASTQLRVESFNMMLAFLLAFLLVQFALHKWRIFLVLFSFLAGACVVQSACFIPLIPVFLLFLIYILLKDRSLSLKRITWMSLIALAGLSLYYFFARSFYNSHDAQLMGHSSLMNLMIKVWRFQLHELRSGLPQSGWIIILLFSVVPWLVAVFAAGRALNNERSWSQYLLHLILFGFVIIGLFNVPVSPWGILRPTGRLPVFFYAMIAMVAGYIFVYWYMLLKVKQNKRSNEIRPFTKKAGEWFGMILTYPAAVIVLLCAVVNYFECKPNRGRFADEFASRILDRLEDRTWFITDGLLDDHLKILAHERGQELNIISLQKDLDPYYLRSMAQLIEEKNLFSGAELISMKSTLKLGILPFVQDWFSIEEEDIADKAAVFGVPDFWYSAGLIPVPEYLFFTGCNDIEKYKDTELFDEYSVFWDEMLAVLPETEKDFQNNVSVMARNLRRHLGFVANNLGVMLEDLGRDEEAFATYTKIHEEIDPDNVSAMINRFEMARRGVKCADPFRDSIERELKDFISGLKRRYPLWSLSRFYGYVRSPQIFARLGYGWALSGQSRAALAGVNRAINLLPENDRIANLNSLASIYALTEQSEESEDVYQEIISNDPNNRRALMGLGRLAVKEGAFEKASKWFTKAAESGDDTQSGGLEWALVHMMNNDMDKARLALQRATDLQPRNLNAWALLAHLQLQNNEVEDVESIVIPKMEKIAGTPDNYFVQLTKAMMNMKKAENDKRPERYLRVAREGFIRAGKLNKSAIYLNDVILDLDIRLNDQEAALLHARQVLRKNRKHSLANYVMGSLRLREGAYGEAEDFLRRSVNAKPIYPALNDLAEVLRRIRRFSDAEKYARDAIKLNPENYIGWETLAAVLVDADIKLDEATSAINKAVSLNKGEDLRVQITKARILKKKGDIELARQVIREIKSRQQELMPFEREEFDRISRDVSKQN